MEAGEGKKKFYAENFTDKFKKIIFEKYFFQFNCSCFSSKLLKLCL